jgi:hypothetical protein
MAIKQLTLPAWKTLTWTAVCDFCSAQSKKLGADAGDASENARKEGFSTVSVRTDLPMKWICGACNNKKTVGKRSS